MDPNGNGASGSHRDAIMLPRKQEVQENPQDLDFVYEDCDAHANEIAELYSYTEYSDLHHNLSAFEEHMNKYKISYLTWRNFSIDEKSSVIMKILDQLEFSDKETRMKSARCILYIAQGGWLGWQDANECIEKQKALKLPWKPKAHRRLIDAFLNGAREKFIGYSLEGDYTTLFGLPKPIHDSVQTLKDHIYVSLTELQIQNEEEINRNPLTHQDEIEITPSELLYQAMFPNLPQYMICLLKILLATTSRAKSNTDSINILGDVLPKEMPMTVFQSMKLGIDVNRHKEIIVKAVSAILLLLLKHFKLNHVYQFEFISQQLVFANCIPLILKFFNQEILNYVKAGNSIPVLDFPSCVLGDVQPDLNGTIEIGSETNHCWRNVFSSINLLRVLNKLCKWKNSRIMMLAKYLGRNWRKSNLKTVSLIYQKVRHHLNDDWAYGNYLDAKPWDFQSEEITLRNAVDKFNNRRYSNAFENESEER
ncbi:hypothetical protein NQ318_019913 [Aromia moschata]|uniref:Far11/STRP C-terminal domain-containing protein n=1 Tax=Aromia moschata TaxID=1265417 RepID=A0AAV8XJY0_9CUCU|nr:hypothetical protein NQ318_019913 [Aromia moschata]